MTLKLQLLEGWRFDRMEICQRNETLAVWQPFMLHLRIEIITKEVSKEVMNFDGVGLVRYSVLGRKTIFF